MWARAVVEVLVRTPWQGPYIQADYANLARAFSLRYWYPDPQFVAPLIEDPLECTRNVSRSCFGIAQIQNVFAHCLCILESQGAAAAMSDDSCNILSLVLSY